MKKYNLLNNKLFFGIAAFMFMGLVMSINVRANDVHIQLDSAGIPTTTGNPSEDWKVEDRNGIMTLKLQGPHNYTVDGAINMQVLLDDKKKVRLVGGTFNHPVIIVEDNTVPESDFATITGGIFNAIVENNNGKITGGTFNGKVENNAIAIIEGGFFNGKVLNDNGEQGSVAEIRGGTFKDEVDCPQGTISNGEFYGRILNRGNYSKISGGIFHADVINSDNATITGGTFEADVTNSNNSKITGGTFLTDVINSGATVTGGTFVLELNTGGGLLENADNYKSYAYGSNLALPGSDKIKYDKDEFLGWYVNVDDESTKTDTIPSDAFGKKTYYAKWKYHRPNTVNFIAPITEGGTADNKNTETVKSASDTKIVSDANTIADLFNNKTRVNLTYKGLINKLNSSNIKKESLSKDTLTFSTENKTSALSISKKSFNKINDELKLSAIAIKNMDLSLNVKMAAIEQALNAAKSDITLALNDYTVTNDAVKKSIGEGRAFEVLLSSKSNKKLNNKIKVVLENIDVNKEKPTVYSIKGDKVTRLKIRLDKKLNKYVVVVKSGVIAIDK